MKYLPLILVLFIAACGSEQASDNGADSDPQEHAHATAEAATHNEDARPAMVDGVQVFEIEAGTMGFAPKKLALEAGVPARLIFTRTIESACSEQVQIPTLGIEKTDLPLNEPVAIDFTPEKGGSYTFVCGMDMQTGTLLVEV